ncbi:bile acid:sodium symporter family protein [Salinibius halmophilus]|uniref:bile acid:sodium symporter family protein n=1 Tax=Salinibius halmophilus TaxID=1853216 RepID=UPI000E66293A|nr:bile acid:sodium symporter family protein [Salinibius halmophilus]
MALDQVQIQFNPESLLLLNALLAFMMFGAALSIKPKDFKYVLLAPKAPLIGLFCQFVLLPALTWLLIQPLNISPSLALGMILVAACPGGSFSNIMTWLSRGSLATSVSMTAISSAAAMVMTPLNFAFYASLSADTRELVANIAVSPLQMATLVALVLGAPLLLGMLFAHYRADIASKLEKIMRTVSLVIFLGFVAIAFGNNGSLFIEHAPKFAALVIGHNLLAITIGWSAGWLARLPASERRAITLEVGIQNSGLALILLFTFYPTVGGMMLIAAFWGVWHLVSGLTLAWIWGKRPPLVQPN